MINFLPRDLLTDIMLKNFTIYELAFIARVCKLWNALQKERVLYRYKTSLLIRYPETEGYLPNNAFKADCIKAIFMNLPPLEGLKKISDRLYVAQNSIVVPYGERLFLMTIDPLFISSQSRMHGIIKINNEHHFYCASPKIATRRRVFRPYQLILGEHKQEIKPASSIHEQLQIVGAFPIAFETIKGWNNPSLTYYLLAGATPYLFAVKGLDLIALYSVPTSQCPLRYEKKEKEDIYHFHNEIWSIESFQRSIRIKITQKTT